MTAPARTQNQTAATPTVEMSLIDSIIEQTINGKDSHKRLAPFLSVGQSYDRIAAQVREAIIKTPKLAECDPNTIIDAVVTIQRWRLEIGETAYLVPFWDDRRKRFVCTPVRGYIGDIELLINNGLARRVDAFCVYEKEPFTYREGTSPILEHQPLAPSQRGKMLGAYAILWQTFTNCKAVFVFMEDIEAIREGFSKQWKAGLVGACPPWYAKKCAVKAVTKLLPKSPKVAKLREQMEEDEIIVASATRGISDPRPAHISDDGEDLSDAHHVGAAAEPTLKPEPIAATVPTCPECQGAMWDNREKKALGRFSPKAPDFSCKDRSCSGKIWKAKEPDQAIQATDASADLVLDQQLLADEAREASPPGSKRVDMPKGGRVEDAMKLPLNDEPKKPNRNAQMD